MTRPKAMFAAGQGELFTQIFDAEALERLSRSVDLCGIPLATDTMTVPEAARDVEILITGWGVPAFDGEMLARWPRLRAIVHAAGSVKRVVTPALWERGIRISSCALANAYPVAEYTLAMILLSAKDTITTARRFARTRDLVAARPAPSRGAFGVTVGIVGASRIGRRVIELLRPFDIDVMLYDPSVSTGDAAALGVELVTLPDLLAGAGIVSVHAPSLPETHRMIGAAELALMGDGAVLINTARGALVDTDALVAELVTGRLRAVLDVTDPEPLPKDHPLFDLDNAVLTPHVAGSLGNELRRIGEQVVDEVESFVAQGDLAAEVLPLDLVRIA